VCEGAWTEYEGWRATKLPFPCFWGDGGPGGVTILAAPGGAVGKLKSTAVKQYIMYVRS
jgi:hypothetical protein